MSRAAYEQTLKVNQLLDLDWSFGVCASSDELENVGSTFLKMKFTVDKVILVFVLLHCFCVLNINIYISLVAIFVHKILATEW